VRCDEDPDAAVAAAEAATPSGRVGPQARVAALARLGEALLCRHVHTAAAGDLDRAVTAYREAVALSPPGHPDHRAAEHNLAVALTYHDRLADTDEAIGIWRRHVAATSAGSTAQSEALTGLGGALERRLFLAADGVAGEVVAGAVDEAVAMLTTATERLTVGTGPWLVARNGLAVALLSRGNTVHAQPDDTARAVAILEDLHGRDVAGAITGGTRVVVVNLERARLQLMRDTGVTDLRHPDRLLVDDLPADGPLADQSEPAVGQVESTRALLDFYTTGRLSELDRAVSRLDAAVRTLSPQHPELAATLVNCASAHHVRATARRAADPAAAGADLVEAVRLGRRALAAANGLRRSSAQGVLATALLDEFVHLGGARTADLDEVVVLLTAAVHAPGADRSVLPHNRLKLADAHLVRALRTGRADDLETAIAIHAELGRTAGVESDPLHAARLSQLLLVKAEATGTTEDALLAAGEARRACQGLGPVSPVWALRTASEWGRWAWRRGALREVGEAHEHALGAMHQLSAAQLVRRDKEAVLSSAAGIAQRAAYALVHTGEPERAVVALEAGRALLLAEAFQRDRRDLERLAESGHADLLDDYRAATSRGAALAATLDSPPGEPADTRSRRLRAAAAAMSEVDDVIARIRQLPRYDDLLRPTGLETIRSAAASAGGVLYLAATDRGGVAVLAGEDGSVRALRLPMLTTRAEAELLGAHRAATAADDGPRALAVTRRLWSTVVAPVMPLLAGRDRVTIVPCGLLGMLPLHAAARPDRDTATGWRYLLDDLVVSYAPNAAAVARVHRDASAAAGSALVAVAEPVPVHQRPLPLAVAEAQHVVACYPAGGPVLAGAAATVPAVLAALPGGSVLHFACHADVDPADPLSSGMIMAGDRRLAVRDLMAMNLDGARLAVLSACHTAAFGADLPDEAVGLPVGMVTAGVPGVVATGWATPDHTAFLTAVRFHQCWRTASGSPAAALRRTQQWIRDSTNAEKRAAFPGVAAFDHDKERDHMSEVDWMDMRADANPLRWAAFSMVGA
jgi:CHAT domain-containing protein